MGSIPHLKSILIELLPPWLWKTSRRVFFWEWAILVVMVEAKVPTFWCLNLKHHLKEVDNHHFHLSELAFIQFKPCEIIQHLFQLQPIFCFQLTSLSISPSLAASPHIFYGGGMTNGTLWYFVVPSFQSSNWGLLLTASLDIQCTGLDRINFMELNSTFEQSEKTTEKSGIVRY